MIKSSKRGSWERERAHLIRKVRRTRDQLVAVKFRQEQLEHVVSTEGNRIRLAFRQGQIAVADELLLQFRGIADGSVAIKRASSPMVAMRELLSLIRDWITPFSSAAKHANNASLRRGAVLPPPPGFPLPLTIELAVHNVHPETQVVTAILHRTDESHAATAMLESRLGPYDRSGPPGLVRMGQSLARDDRAAMILDHVLKAVVFELVEDYKRHHLQAFAKLLHRRPCDV